MFSENGQPKKPLLLDMRGPVVWQVNPPKTALDFNLPGTYSTHIDNGV